MESRRWPSPAPLSSRENSPSAHWTMKSLSRIVFMMLAENPTVLSRHGRVVTDSFLMLVKVGFQTLKADDEVVTLSHRIGAEVKGTIAEYKGEGDPAAQHPNAVGIFGHVHPKRRRAPFPAAGS